MRKPKGYWTKENTVKELQLLIGKIGKFPTWYEMKDNSSPSLASSVTNYGGTNHFRKLLGYPIKIRGKGELKSEEAIKEILSNNFGKMISNKNFPTCKMLMNAGLGSIVSVIFREYGGLTSFSRKIGCHPRGVFQTSDGHFVSSAMEYEFDEFLFTYGIEHDYNQRISFIVREKYRYDFKLQLDNKDYYVEIWGFDQGDTEIQNQYAKTRVKKERLYKELGLNLIGIEKSAFNQSPEELKKYFINIFEHLGHCLSESVVDYNIDASPRLYSKKLTQKHLEEMIKRLGYFPNSTELFKMEKHSLVQAICKFGGFNYWRELLGFNNFRKSHNYWNEETVLLEVKRLVEEYGHLPPFHVLFQDGKNDIAVAINRNGGFNYFKTKLNLPVTQKTRGYYKEQSKVMEDLKEVIDKVGHFPSHEELKSVTGSMSLGGAISAHGGIRKFKILWEEENSKKKS